jgi:hypothetical protein
MVHLAKEFSKTNMILILLFSKTNHILFNFFKNKSYFIQLFFKSQTSKFAHQIRIEFCFKKSNTQTDYKELFSKGFDQGESSAAKEKGSFQGHGNHSSGHSNGSKGSSNFTKLEFSRYLGNDPNVWLNWVVQYFDYKQTLEEQKVSLTTFHLESEANQWWQWVQKLCKEEPVPITWEAFERELLIRFGPLEVEDYGKALTKIQQAKTLREYQQEFESLANRVEGWRQKALVEAFLGGLKPDIVYAVRMFKPKTLRGTPLNWHA